MAILGLIHDEPHFIESLARRLTETRPDRTEKVYASLLCLPGLVSSDITRVDKSLRGIMSASSLSFRNLSKSAFGCMLVSAHTYYVSEFTDLSKLQLDLAVLCANIWKLDITPFGTGKGFHASPAQRWRDEIPGNYSSRNDHADPVLGAEALFAHMCSGRLPGLFKCIAWALGMKEMMVC